MGKKARIKRYPQKYGRKYSSHPVAKANHAVEEAKPAPVEVAAPKAEEAVKPTPEPKPVAKPKATPKKKPAAKPASKPAAKPAPKKKKVWGKKSKSEG